MNLGTDITDDSLIALSADALRRHIYIIGKSGVGKSGFLRGLTLDAIEQGYGLCLLDPHGDLGEEIVQSMPKGDIQRALYWEPFDPQCPMGYNPIKDIPYDSRPLAAENILSAFSQVWGLSNQHTPRLLHILRNSIRLLLDKGDASLIDLQRLLTDKVWRDSILKIELDPTVKAFWHEEYDAWNAKQRGEYIASLQNKVGALVSNPAMRRTLSEGRAFSPAHAMNSGQVVIVNLSKGKLGEESSALLGSLLTSGFAQAAHERADIPERERRDFLLVIDEFQNFTTTAFAGILSEARKYRLGLVVAHQFMSQLPDFLQDSVIGTANTLVAFRVGARDAPILAAELDIEQPRRLKNLPDYQALVRTADSPQVRQMATFPPELPGTRLGAVRRRTRAVT